MQGCPKTYSCTTSAVNKPSTWAQDRPRSRKNVIRMNASPLLTRRDRIGVAFSTAWAARTTLRRTSARLHLLSAQPVSFTICIAISQHVTGWHCRHTWVVERPEVSVATSVAELLFCTVPISASLCEAGETGAASTIIADARRPATADMSPGHHEMEKAYEIRRML